MRVLIFEPKFVGHFLGFASWAANAYAKRGHEVILAVSSKARDTRQAAIKLTKVDPSVQLRYTIDVPVLYDRWKNARFECQALADELDQVRPDHLVIPSGDFVLSGLLVSASARQRVNRLRGADFILHNCRHSYPAQGTRDRIGRWLDRLAVDVARHVRLLTVDPYVNREGAPSHSFFGHRILPLPHPFESLAVTDPALARASLSLPAGRRILSSIGDLGVRKGTDLLIRSFAACADQVPDLDLALFGLLSKDVRQLLQQYQTLVDRRRITVRDEFVSDQEFVNALYAVDGIWAGYPRQIGIPSMLLFAAAANRPVIGSDFGCVGWMIEEYGMGRTFSPTVRDACDAIQWFANTTDYQPDPVGAARLLNYHSLENFEEVLTTEAGKM